jgi:hypothetical protein
MTLVPDGCFFDTRGKLNPFTHNTDTASLTARVTPYIPVDHYARGAMRDEIWYIQVRSGHELLVWADEWKYAMTHKEGDKYVRLCDEKLPDVWTTRQIETFENHYRWA